MFPEHSMSTLGLSTVRRCIRFRSLSPQNSTSILYRANVGLMPLGTGRTGPISFGSVSWYIGISFGCGNDGRDPSISFGISKSSKAAKSSPARSVPLVTGNLEINIKSSKCHIEIFFSIYHSNDEGNFGLA